MQGLFIEKNFYHIYPLGMCGCPKKNDFSCEAGNAFEKLAGELDRLKSMGINALYIGPLFESTSHGYDTLDYFHVDRRLGNNEKFARFTEECHKRGIAVVLDAVFNHTGREFFAFKDLIQNGTNSIYKDWYLNVKFDGRSCYGDNFDYDGWAGCKDLVKLNVDNPEVRNHIFSAVEMWINEFHIDGLRLDAADVLSGDFMDALTDFCKSKKQDFWLMGEVVHGDYNYWAHKGRLDSVTNYQIYKAMWSALNEKNMHELAYNLNREFGETGEGIYKDIALYNFLDNHDVNRIASTLNDCRQLHFLYGLMFTIPGIPSVFYGSEYGIRGERGACDDFQLRPAIPPFRDGFEDFSTPVVDSESLVKTIGQFAKLRSEKQGLIKGNYKQLFVAQEQLGFLRSCDEETLVVCANGSEKNAVMCLNEFPAGRYLDILTGEEFHSNDLKGIMVSAFWFRILKKI